MVSLYKAVADLLTILSPFIKISPFFNAFGNHSQAQEIGYVQSI